MRIGIDIDDTITNTYIEITKNISKCYNTNHNELIEKHYKYDELNILFPKAFTKQYMFNSISNIKLKKDVKKYLNKISENNEIFFITARNNLEYDFPYNLTYKFLNKHNLPFNELLVNISDKAKYCLDNNVDLFIDDSIKSCEATNDLGIDTILFDAPYNKQCNLNRYDNWEDIYNYIERK